jgi:hypothetical protein
MKKFLFLMLTIVLAVGLSAPAFAVHPSEPSEQVPLIGKAKIELGGSLRFRGDHRTDTIGSYSIDPITDDVTGFSKDDSRGSYDGRVRLHLNAYVTDNTMGRVQLETGGSNASDTYGWGCTDERDPAGFYEEGNCKKDELRVLEAWIQHSFAAAPITLKGGHMPLKLGRGLFFNHTRFGDDAITISIAPNDAMTIDLLTVKFDEGDPSDSDDDADAYIGQFNYKQDTISFGADLTYVNDKDWILENIVGGDNVVNGTTELWNLGIRGEVDVSGVGIYGDVEFQFGEAPLSDWDPLLDDVDFGGYAVVVGVDAKVGEIGLNAEFGIGSGQSEEDFDDDEINEFVTALSSIQKFTYVYDYRMATASIAGSTNTGIANTTYIKVGADTKVTPDLSLAGEIYWLQATEEIFFIDKDGASSREDELGWEIDARAKYNIDKNLQYFIEGGILFTGELYDELSFAAGEEDDDAYVVRQGIQLAF